MTTETGNGILHILLVEDNPSDAFLAQVALSHTRVPYDLTMAEDGEGALSMLERFEALTGVGRPDLIFLDLNLPNLDGFEVLAAIRASADFSTIPVVVLSSTDSDEDVDMSYRLGANVFLPKPYDIDTFSEMLVGALDFFYRERP